MSAATCKCTEGHEELVMDGDVASPLKDININPLLAGRVTKCGVVGRGDAVVLDSVGQILDVLRTGELDTNKDEAEQVANEQTNELGRERLDTADSGIFNSVGAPVDQSGYVNKVFSDSSDVSKKLVQPSQQHDSDSTTDSSEEDEEDPVGNGVMLPRQGGVQMQSNLQNCNNVQVGNKVEISGALTVNTVLNVVSPTSEANVVTAGAAKEPLPPQSLLKRRPPWLLGMGALALLVLAVFIVTMAIVIPRKLVDDEISRPPITLPDDEADNMTLPGGHRIFSKEQWGGYPARFERELIHPTPFVVISHTADEPCYSFVACVQMMRKFQDLHMASEMPDIGYNFVVGNDGNVYEGRGWDTTNMHTGYVRRCNIGISLNGHFVHDYPTKAQINATLALLDLGVRLGKLSVDYKLVGMNQTYETLSPGPILYGIIKEWPHHWIETSEDIAEEPDFNSTLPGGHHIYSKKAWGGDPPRFRRDLKHPTPFVVISDTVTQECYTHVECARRVRIIQSYHMGEDWLLGDVGYSFLVGGDGNVYVGRGWDTTSMHTGFVRNCNIAITLVGKFIDSAPTKRQINATIELIKRGVEMGYIAEDYKLIGFRQTRAVNSPGIVLFNMIKTWPHYWEETKDEAGQCPSS